MPILDGHRRASPRAEIESQIRQANIKQQAARRQIEVQVRLAFEARLDAAARQVDLAEQKSSLEAEADSGEIAGSVRCLAKPAALNWVRRSRG